MSRSRYSFLVAIVVFLLASISVSTPQNANAGICGVTSTGLCYSDSDCWTGAPGDESYFFCDRNLPRPDDDPASGGICNTTGSAPYQCSDQALQCGWNCGRLGYFEEWGYPGWPPASSPDFRPLAPNPEQTQNQQWTLSTEEFLRCTHMTSVWEYVAPCGDPSICSKIWRENPLRYDLWSTDPTDPAEGGACGGLYEAYPTSYSYTHRLTMSLPIDLAGTGYYTQSCSHPLNKNRFLVENKFWGYDNSTDPRFMALVGKYAYWDSYDGIWNANEDPNPNVWNEPQEAYSICRTVINNNPPPLNCSLQDSTMNPTEVYFQDIAAISTEWEVTFAGSPPPDPENVLDKVTFTVPTGPQQDLAFVLDIAATPAVPSYEFVDDTPTDYYAIVESINDRVTTETITLVGERSTFGGATSCTETIDVKIIPPPPWWQVLGAGDVTVGAQNDPASDPGDIIAEFPAACTKDPANCDDVFIVEDSASGTHGVVIHEGSTSYTQSYLSAASANTQNWSTQTTNSLASQEYNYAHFKYLSQGKFINPVGAGTITGDTIEDATPDSDGYIYIQVEPGNVISDSAPLNFGGNKGAIILVEGDFIVGKDIKLVDPTKGFLMLVVSGSIIVEPNVREMEGVYFADKEFKTGTDGVDADGVGLDKRELKVRGMVAALGGFDLQRNLEDNSITAAETFEYAPEFMVNFPTSLSDKHLIWQEIVP